MEMSNVKSGGIIECIHHPSFERRLQIKGLNS